MKYVLIVGLILVALIQIQKTGVVEKFFADAVTPQKIDPNSPAARARLSKYSWGSRAERAIRLPTNGAAVAIFNDRKEPVTISVSRTGPDKVLVAKLKLLPGRSYCSLLVPASGTLLIEVRGERDISNSIRPNEYLGWVFTDND